MADGHERFGAAERQRARIDLRLIPEFESVDGRRLGRVHRLGWRQVVGREHGGDTIAQIRLAERGWEQRQQGKAELRTKLPDRRHHGRNPRPKHEHLAVESLGREQFHRLAGLDPAGRQPDHNEVERSQIKLCAQLGDVGAFASRTTEILQRL